MTSWCHMCRSLKTLMPCSAPSTWKRCFRNCVIPCVSNIPWSEIFSGSVSESRMTYCHCIWDGKERLRDLHHPIILHLLSVSFQTYQLPGVLMVIMMASLGLRFGDPKFEILDPLKRLDQLLRCSQCPNSNKPWKSLASSCPQRTGMGSLVKHGFRETEWYDKFTDRWWKVYESMVSLPSHAIFCKLLFLLLQGSPCFVEENIAWTSISNLTGRVEDHAALWFP